MTEDQVIINHTKQWFEDTSSHLPQFVTELLTPKLEKLGLYSKEDIVGTEHFLRWRASRITQAERIMKGTTNFPLSWKWAWITSMPEPYQSSCRKELLALAGVLNVPLPISQAGQLGTGTQANLAQIMHEFSEFIAAAAPAQDGSYDHTDDKVATQKYADEIIDVIEALKRELVQIQAGTGIQSKRLTISAQITVE